MDIDLKTAYLDGTIDDVRRALSAGADPNQKFGSSPPLITMSPYFGIGLDKIEALLDAGADIESRGRDGNTVIMNRALGSVNCKVVKALIERGANPNAVNVYGARLLAATHG